jgi:7,8-dihydropterin-6-yl-methyl-4-(beta-D-ribofuranosyl)aminobenzene 5'-phosphate synthase
MEVSMALSIQEIDRIEILTLQDNYVDLVSRDNTEIVLRAMPLKDMEVKNSILAEHGFSSVVTLTGEASRSMLFDFGFSEGGAAFNADALSLDLSTIEVSALSHGHLDHVGGMHELMKLVNREGMELVVHPEAFRNPRYLKITEDVKVMFPSFTREKAEMAGFRLVETKEPYPLLDGSVLFLGEIPRITDFERGMPSMFYQKDGVEIPDDIIDDTAIVANVKGRGLVVISGCAHAGIVNTVRYAKELTGIDEVYVIMGGFHLTGAEMAPAIDPTIAGLKELDPDYLVPTHCTGRNAILQMEREMPDKFIVNMAGTKLTFAA